ncbi:MAG: lipid-A-disaccharide synthase [Alistipes sp.]|nr:lipid-A-disaccharide synthase [Alistipes sp.]
MKYYIISGEPSGDLHGSNLMRGLQAEDSEAQFRFWGGDKMAEVGGAENLAKHYRETSFFGIAQVLRNLKTIFGQIDECKRDIESYSPDVVILIDYPSFNMRIAKWAKERGIKVFYYIAPKVWAWKEWRVKAIRKYVDRLYTIFPFETDYFRSKGIEPVFCGNPLCDSIAQYKAQMPSREEFLRECGLDERPIVALLAGSRRSEIKDNLVDMVAISRNFPNYQFVAAAVPWLERDLYERILAGTAVKVVCNKTYDTLVYAEAAIVTSGTATLETALIGTPEIVMYHVPKIYEWLRPIVLKIPYISLVNINLNRECVREIVVNKIDVEAVSEELRAILECGSKRAKMLADFAELQEMMGGEGSSLRVAQDIVKSLK